MVAVDNAALEYDKLYSYAVPDALRERAVVGARVTVPFGTGRPRAGVILDISTAQDGAVLKELLDAESGEPAMTPELMRLVKLLRETTFCTYADAVKVILPKFSRMTAGADDLLKSHGEGHLETAYEYREGSLPPRITEKQRAVCELVRDNPQTASQITQALGVTRAVADRLADKAILRRFERVKPDETYADYARHDIPPLTAAQRAAADKLVSLAADETKPDTTLLFGVTSSGKTLVYIELIQNAVAQQRGALVLVPEIALATQMIYRLRELFGARVGIIHSALSDTERQIQWERIKSGEYDVIVGTRSAVFAPVRSLGVIIIDEEQESSFLSEHSPRYDARAVAAFRARENGAQLLLASATPSIESFYKAQSGAYNLVRLDERYRDMPLPKVDVVDMRAELLAGNSHYISLRLKEEIDARLKRGEQCILLLNRRGYRTLSMCCSCKKIVKCPSCDTPLVVHKGKNCYLCHYCGRALPVDDVCDSCGGRIKHTGIGTQKIEEELETLFPSARVLRLDVDSASRKHGLENRLREFARGEYDIIIGTQMVAKGLDFANVTLVGVLSLDLLLLMPSFRARERTFAMLTQVVGRSGRGDKKGEAVIQTLDPDSDVIKLAAKQDYDAFYAIEIASRKAHLYPPFCAISSVGAVAERETDAARAAQAFALLAERAQKSRRSMPIRILGPAPMRVAYINDLYRYRIVFKSRGDREFRELLRECLDEWRTLDEAKHAKLFVDFAGELDN